MRKNVCDLIKNIEEFMDDETIRKSLVDKYGEDERFVYGLNSKEIIGEIAACISDEDPGYATKLPHYAEVLLSDGSTIDSDGTIHHYPRVELEKMGYNPKQLISMSEDEIYEEWCQAKNRPLSDDYVKKKARKLKKEMIKSGFTSLKGSRIG